MNEYYFFLIFVLTILVTRIFLFIKPVASPTIKGFRIHHWMYGITLIILSFIFSNITMYAVGLGLFVDELSYILIGGENHKDNYSTKSLLGTVIFILAIYLLRNQILGLLI